ncbi:histidine-containing phosphotransfer protein 1 isoform X5 [Beta vulgaris subsp. vulgaris]|uniref:histidine-containing phosphotransfer protein 1 isoform X5 n=1 Tax=Beta vulgaris subsp. vulgaris TaxID=3555 RepID=UPI00053FC3FD|nr:histidine-containing phosphotransfer protein 1 isoform X5 [Beta vulgaris subsp. vulgaris]
MDVVQLLERQFIDYMKSLYMEHYLDDQFTQLQKLADESNPDFVYEVVTLFFQDSEKLIDNLTKALNLQVIDFNQVANHAHQFKGSSSRCLTVLQDLQQEYIVLKKKFEILFQLEQDIVKNGGTIPTMD